MNNHAVVTREEWLSERRSLLAREKEFTRARDALAQARRELPWVRVDKQYVFQGPNGDETLSDLFAGRNQLIVYHFMFAPEWEAGCKSCTFWADHFDGMVPHLAHRDVRLAAISRAPLAKLTAYAKRMGWKFKWVSSGQTDFNFDYAVSFTPKVQSERQLAYNFGTIAPPSSDMPGVSTFYKDDSNEVFHCYSSYSRGIDALNATYQFLDIAPKGRDEAGLPAPMAWVRRRDEL